MCAESQIKWSRNRFCLVTLMELLEFHAHDFSELTSIIGVMRALIHNGHEPTQEQANALGWAVKRAKEECVRLELHTSNDQCDAITYAIEHGSPLSHQSFAGLLRELQDRIRSELSHHLFFAVPSSVQSFYEHQQFDPAAVTAFPSAIDDMLESGKCFALSRYTASVFHLNRIVETGLRALTDDIGVKLQHDWGAQLREIEKELEKRYKTAGARTPDEQFYSEAATQIGHIKNAWRNPTMHIERRYNEELARDIFNAVKALMRVLATRLKE
jgi:hypothetical protein